MAPPHLSISAGSCSLPARQPGLTSHEVDTQGMLLNFRMKQAHMYCC